MDLNDKLKDKIIVLGGSGVNKSAIVKAIEEAKIESVPEIILVGMKPSVDNSEALHRELIQDFPLVTLAEVMSFEDERRKEAEEQQARENLHRMLPLIPLEMPKPESANYRDRDRINNFHEEECRTKNKKYNPKWMR
jgi:hypothetical protein